MKKINKSGIYVVIFLTVFVFFMAWYFVICQNSSIAPSDWALVSLGAVCAVECVVAAWVHSKPKLDQDDKNAIEFVAECVGKVLNVQAPVMRSAEKGEEPIHDIYAEIEEEVTDDESVG